MKSQAANSDLICNLGAEEQEQLGLILDAYMIELEQAAKPDVDVLCAEYPHLENAIRHYVSSLRLIHGAARARYPSHVSPERSLDINAKQIGEYDLIREIGRGGMGVVYEANQRSLGRRVALKILPFAAVLDPKQIARFQNEAQAAAQLHHPNIVPVYSIGNDRGTYFYSMQLIEGQSLECAIDDLQSGHDLWKIGFKRPAPSVPDCHPDDTTQVSAEPVSAAELSPSFDERNNTPAVKSQASTARSARSLNHIRRAVELVIQAAEALQYAHEHGIVHRDIKPSNLLVDRFGKLWITDFGLAQCASFENLTRSGDIVGTLRYMSPEQATGRSHWVDNRTDIYSLGLTLYELLTLEPVVRGNDRIAMIRQIEVGCPIAPRRINAAIPVDLENIIIKTLSKHREDRYTTAGELAKDLELFLAGRPPLVRRPSMLDRASRWVARNSRAVSLATLAMGSLLTLAVVINSILLSKNREVTDANARANKHLEIAHQVVDKFGAQLLSRLDLIPETDELQIEIAQNSIDYLTGFVQYAKDEPSQHAELARALLKLASLHEMRGDDAEAEQRYQQAESLFGRVPPLSEDRDIWVHSKITCSNNLACLQIRKGNLDAAISTFTAAIFAIEGSDLKDRDSSVLTGASLLHLNCGHAYRLRGQESLANDEFDFSLKSLKKAYLQKSSASTEIHEEMQRILIASLLQVGCSDLDLKRSIQLLTSAVKLAESLQGTSNTNWSDAHEVCVCELAVGACWARHDHAGEAKDWFERGVRGLKRLVGKYPTNTKVLSDYASALNNLGQSELELGNLSVAIQSFGDSCSILEDLVANSSDVPQKSNFAGVLNNLAVVRELENDLPEAEKLLSRAITIQESALQTTSGNQQLHQRLEEHQANLDRVRSKISSQSSKTQVGSN